VWPGVEVNILLDRSLPEFYLLAQNNGLGAKIDITKMSLHVQRAYVKETLYAGMYNQHKTLPMFINIRKIHMASVLIPLHSQARFSAIVLAFRRVLITFFFTDMGV
jgi:hypothetical protein